MTESKLNTQLVQEETPETSTEKKLLFTDYSIGRFQGNFLDKDNKRKVRIYKSFDSKNTPKGIRLCQYDKTKSKYFVLQYWFNNKATYLTLGEFLDSKFGTKECLEKYYKIYKDHTNDKGLWIKDPKKTLKDQDNKVYEAESIKLQKKSIREVIEDIFKNDFPSIAHSGNLVASSQKSYSLPMIGYNRRTLLIYFANNDEGYGRIFYKGNKFYGIAQPENAEDLFKKFPPGKGIITPEKRGKKYKGTYKNRSSEKSLYDHELSKHLIEHLEAQHIRDYISENDERSYSQKRIIKRMFAYIWQYSVEKGYISGDKLIPTKNIKVKLPKQNNFKGAQYNQKRFTAPQLTALWDSFLKHQEKFPFSSMALCLAEVTGLRIETILLIKKEYIKKDFLELPYSIVKTKKEQKITITPVVKWILDNIEQTLNKPKYQKYKFIPWLFPSTKTKSKELYDLEYVKTDGTRLKDIRGCWNAVSKDTGIDGAPKMFRKSFISMAKIVLKDNFKVMFLSGHSKEATIDVHYNKSTDEQTKEYANEVAEKVFNFTK
jgi:integrase